MSESPTINEADMACSILFIKFLTVLILSLVSLFSYFKFFISFIETNVNTDVPIFHCFADDNRIAILVFT